MIKERLIEEVRERSRQFSINELAELQLISKAGARGKLTDAQWDRFIELLGEDVADALLIQYAIVYAY